MAKYKILNTKYLKKIIIDTPQPVAGSAVLSASVGTAVIPGGKLTTDVKTIALTNKFTHLCNL